MFLLVYTLGKRLDNPPHNSPRPESDSSVMATVSELIRGATRASRGCLFVFVFAVHAR